MIMILTKKYFYNIPAPGIYVSSSRCSISLNGMKCPFTWQDFWSVNSGKIENLPIFECDNCDCDTGIVGTYSIVAGNNVITGDLSIIVSGKQINLLKHNSIFTGGWFTKENTQDVYVYINCDSDEYYNKIALVDESYTDILPYSSFGYYPDGCVPHECPLFFIDPETHQYDNNFTNYHFVNEDDITDVLVVMDPVKLATSCSTYKACENGIYQINYKNSVSCFGCALDQKMLVNFSWFDWCNEINSYDIILSIEPYENVLINPDTSFIRILSHIGKDTVYLKDFQKSNNKYTYSLYSLIEELYDNYYATHTQSDTYYPGEHWAVSSALMPFYVEINLDLF